MDAATLAAYVGATSTTEFVAECWTTAGTLVARHIGARKVPDDVRDRATLEVGAELFHRRATKNAVAQFASPDAAPVRIARDPMVAAYPLLAPYVGGGFA